LVALGGVGGDDFEFGHRWDYRRVL
jgi:hypothetical protein